MSGPLYYIGLDPSLRHFGAVAIDPFRGRHHLTKGKGGAYTI